MNILVTGANGQLGREMQLVSRHSSDSYFFTDICDGYEHLDITDLVAIRTYVASKRIDAIINCAAWTNVEGAEDPSRYELIETLNATAPENLAIVMKEVGGLLVHISTDYVFGKEPYNTPCREDRIGTPTGIYGLTKLHGEQAIKRVFDSKPVADGTGKGSYLIIRTAWLYSEYGKNFCRTMLSLTATKPELSVVFDQVGTPTYALDLAAAICKIVSERTFIGHTGIYHFSNEGVCSWYDFTKMIQQIASDIELSSSEESVRNIGRQRLVCQVRPCHSSEFPSPVERPAFSVLDKTKIKETFGIDVPYWTDSLRKCIEKLCSQLNNNK